MKTWDGRDLTGAELLRAAAERLRVTDPWLAELLDAAADAFPIDPSQPPRNPIDRRVILKALRVAAEVVRHAA